MLVCQVKVDAAALRRAASNDGSPFDLLRESARIDKRLAGCAKAARVSED